MTRRKSSLICRCFAVLPLFFVLVAGTARAEDRKFLGLDITAHEGEYLVTKGANIRAKPKTGAKKLGTVKAGVQVHVVGRAKGGAGWMAVQKDGKDYGFVYAPILLPMIDGTLDAPIKGKARIERRSPCNYTFEFRGKNTVEGEQYVYSDYEIVYRCRISGKPVQILAAMFMTEVPYLLTHKPVFQISIDLMDVENGFDEIFSTTFNYKRDKKKVVFAGVSIKKMGRPLKTAEWPANSVAGALTLAVEMAPGAWGKEVWKQLSQAQVEGAY